MMQEHFLSKERLVELKTELEHLKGPMYKKISEQLAAAIEMGDLSENAAYDDALDRKASMERRISELENIVANAQIIKKDKDSTIVNLGSVILVKDENGNKKEFTIVGYNEADPSVGKISNESPLGRSFMGREVNDDIEVQVPKGIIKFKIMSVN